MTIKTQILRFLFFALGILVTMAVAGGWSFLAFGLLPGSYAWLVNFLGWAAIGLTGQQLVWSAARRLFEAE
jgi:hypothetical protein